MNHTRTAELWLEEKELYCCMYCLIVCVSMVLRFSLSASIRSKLFRARTETKIKLHNSHTSKHTIRRFPSNIYAHIPHLVSIQVQPIHIISIFLAKKQKTKMSVLTNRWRFSVVSHFGSGHWFLSFIGFFFFKYSFGFIFSHTLLFLAIHFHFNVIGFGFNLHFLFQFNLYSQTWQFYIVFHWV